MIIVSEDPIDPATMFDKIGKSRGGSVLLHYAVVKQQVGRAESEGIHFEISGDIEGELSAISSDLKQRRDIEDVLLVRRTGTLNVGDVISLVAVSSPSSNDAFDACHHGLERLKQMKTLKKTERLFDKESH